MASSSAPWSSSPSSSSERGSSPDKDGPPSGDGGTDLGQAAGQLRLRSHAELGVDPGQMGLDRAAADEETIPDLLGGQPLGRQLRHFPLPAGEGAGTENGVGGPPAG